MTASYNGKEFFRIGYYVYNSYTDPELIENPPEKVRVEEVARNILADKPRITRFDIRWEEKSEEENSFQLFNPNESFHDVQSAPQIQNYSYQDSNKVGGPSDVMSGLFNEKYGENSNNPFFANSIGSGSNGPQDFNSFFMDNKPGNSKSMLRADS